MAILESVWEAAVRDFPLIIIVISIVWWGGIALMMISYIVSSLLYKVDSGRRHSRVRKYQYNGLDGKIEFKIDPEQLEDFLIRKDQELRDDIERMWLDFEAQAILEGLRQTIKKKLTNLEATVSERKAQLLGIYHALDDLKYGFDPDQIIRARRALIRCETSEAETLFKQAVAMGKKMAAEAADSKVALEMGNKKAAEASYQLGRLAEIQFNHLLAAQYYHQAVQLQPTNLSYLNAAAEFSYPVGEDNDAEQYLKRVLRIQEKLLGPEHPEVAQTLNKLGVLWHTQGRYKEAEALYLWALEVYETTLSSKHPDVINLVENYAALLRQVGRVDEIGAIKSRFPVP
jgi:tetratricopeptide (TPR) repeat protein